MQYYDVHELARRLEDIVSVMSPHFSSKPGTYYSDALFFLSLGLHRIAPVDQKVAAMFDADTKFRRDVKELFEEFDNFGEEALFGLAPELTPVYRHVLYLYRSKHAKTAYGEPAQAGGFPGFNSGMVLFNLERLRGSSLYERIVGKESVDAMTKKYHFKVGIPFGNYSTASNNLDDIVLLECYLSGSLGRSRFLHDFRYGTTRINPHHRLRLEQAIVYVVEGPWLRGRVRQLFSLQLGN